MKIKRILLFLAALTLLAGVPAMAQPGGPGGPGGGPCGPNRFLENLPPEKRAAIEKLVGEQQTKHFELRQRMRVKSAQLEAAVLDAKADPAGINALADELGAMRTTMLKDQANMRHEVFTQTGVVLPKGKGRSGGPGGGPGGGRGGRF